MKKKFVNSLSVLFLLTGCATTAKGEIIPVASFHEDSSSEEAELATDLLKQLGMEDSMTQITSRKMTGMLFEGNKDEVFFIFPEKREIRILSGYSEQRISKPAEILLPPILPIRKVKWKSTIRMRHSRYPMPLSWMITEIR